MTVPEDDNFKVGERVCCISPGEDDSSSSSSSTDISVDGATVRFVGQVAGTKGTWVGVEWDNWTRGKHDGCSKEGVRYFTTAHPTSGSFVRPHKLLKGVCLSEGVKHRYGLVEGDTGGVDKAELARLQKEINAPFLEVVGFDKVNRRQGDFKQLRIVSLRSSRIVGLGSSSSDRNLAEWMPNVTELDLSENLIGDWAEIVEIGRQLARLQVLNVSGNKMKMLGEEDSSSVVLKEAFPNLKQLVVGNMGYGWREIVSLAAPLPRLQCLHAPNNQIVEIETLPEGALAKLSELDLNGNPIKEWSHIMQFSSLPCLSYMNANACQITRTLIPDVVNDDVVHFPSLRFLSLSDNLIDNWTSVAQLGRLKSLQEMRIRSNPVLATENGGTCRQIFIASVPTLKVLNGTEIFKMERYGAELDYMKKYGMDYLGAVKIGGSALDEFLQLHPRYPEFVQRFGPVEEAELMASARAKTAGSNIKGSLVEVEIDCPSVPGFVRLRKKLPMGMTTHKLRTLLQRLVKVKGYELEISYRSKKEPDFEIRMDNDQRELGFYSLAEGDTILVKW